MNWRTGERRISTDKEWKADIWFNVFFCDWSRHAESERRVPIGDFVPFHSVICKCSQNIIPTGTLGPVPRKYLLKLIGFFNLLLIIKTHIEKIVTNLCVCQSLGGLAVLFT